MILHSQVLNKLLDEIKPIDFNLLTELKKGQKLQAKHYAVICIESVLETAVKNNWGLGKSNGFMYVFNGEYWQQLNKNDLQNFLGKAAEKMGVDIFSARYYAFKDNLYKQFMSAGAITKLSLPNNLTRINLLNGTFEIDPIDQRIRGFDRNDFLQNQLPFSYEPEATAPLFESFLNTVLPIETAQAVLAEFLGYVFIQPSVLKLEKTLLLYGSGANGKSVLFEIVNALLGEDNVSNYSLHRVTSSDYTRAKLSGKLLNYATEISGSLDTGIFKQLISGEPVEARLPYGEPFILTDYAKFLFNCNELPKEVEHNNGYYRRIGIVPFNVTIPPEKQDKKLAEKIIAAELSGVFNWVLEGLKRVLKQNGFTDCPVIFKMVEQYKKEANAAQLFLDDYDYWPSESQKMALPVLYSFYRDYCKNNGYNPLNNINFKRRLENMGIKVIRANTGYQAYLQAGQPTAAPQPPIF